MVAAVATVENQFERRDDWAFQTYDTFAGPYTEIQVKGKDMNYIMALGRDLVVSGMTVHWYRGGGGASFVPWFHVLSPHTGTLIDTALPAHTTTATVDPAQYTDLGLPLVLHSGTILTLVGGTLALDTVRITVWGTYRLAEPLEQPTAPVAVQEIAVWPWKR